MWDYRQAKCVLHARRRPGIASTSMLALLDGGEMPDTLPLVGWAGLPRITNPSTVPSDVGRQGY
jgi:hypothetical protein